MWSYDLAVLLFSVSIQFNSSIIIIVLFFLIGMCQVNIIIVSEKTNQTVKLDASTVEIEERGVKLRLTVVDTPGYGDAIDNTDCFKVRFGRFFIYYLN